MVIPMPDRAPGAERRTDLVWGAALFAAALAAFLVTPMRGTSDAQYALLVSEALIEHGSIRLDPWFDPGTKTAPARDLPYQIESTRGHAYYAFPHGTSILSVPLVAAARLFGSSSVDADGAYDPAAEARMERALASGLSAVFLLLVFLTARLAAPRPTAAIVALAAGFATPVWAVASRATWSHDWLLVLYAVAVLLLVRWELHDRRPHPALLATLLAWAFFVRPTAAVGGVAIAAYVAWRRPRDLVTLVPVGLLWIALFVASTRAAEHCWLLSSYRPGRLGSPTFLEALAGALLSPGRGLLLYCPVAAAVPALLVRFWRDVPGKRLVAVFGGAVAMHVIVVAAFPHWWGGHSFGPRLLVDTVPFLAALAALGLAGARGSSSWIAGAAVLLALSVAIQASGALSIAPHVWNLLPTDIDTAPARLWDLADYPPLRALR
jgi:hypothetical protein